MKETTLIVEYFGGKVDEKNSTSTVLDRIAEPATELLYGKGSLVMLHFELAERRGDAYVEKAKMEACYPPTPWSKERKKASAEEVLEAIKGVLRLAKFSFGKKVALSFELNERGQMKVTNSTAQVQYFDPLVVKLYNCYRLHLSRFTEPLERDGVDSIRISDGDDETAVVFDKKDRIYLRCDKGSVLSENECDLFLEIVAPKLNGSADGWRFCEGKGGYEFTARIEDTDFLDEVNSRDIEFVYGAGMYATVRTVQRKTERTKEEFISDLGEPTETERTIVKVLEFYACGQPF